MKMTTMRATATLTPMRIINFFMAYIYCSSEQCVSSVDDIYVQCDGAVSIFAWTAYLRVCVCVCVCVRVSVFVFVCVLMLFVWLV